MNAIINGANINYIEKGTPDHVSLILIHAFPFNLRMWENQFAELGNTCHLIAYDIRGFGLSDVGDGQFTIELYVDDLIELLDKLKIRKAILCGLSMGGYIALRAFERSPEKIDGLILCNTKSDADSNDAKIKRANNIKKIKNHGLNIFAEDFIKSAFCRNTFELKPDIIQRAEKIILENSPIGVCGALLALAARTDTSSVLDKINVPTCIIAGEYDILTAPEVMMRMHKSIKSSEFHILKNCAHMSNLENPVDFNKTITEFIRKYWG